MQVHLIWLLHLLKRLIRSIVIVTYIKYAVTAACRDVYKRQGEDGIKGVKSVNVSDGEITITKAEDGIQVSEVVYDTDGTTVKAYVTGNIGISGGTFNITSSEDGIQCGKGCLLYTSQCMNSK